MYQYVPEKYVFGGVLQKKSQRRCVTRSPYHRQARVHINSFTEVNFRDFVVGPLAQSSRTTIWEPPPYHIDISFSDSRDPIFISRDP